MCWETKKSVCTLLVRGCSKHMVHVCECMPGSVFCVYRGAPVSPDLVTMVSVIHDYENIKRTIKVGS